MPGVDELTFRRGGAPQVRDLGRLRDGVDAHRLALALGESCPALLESGGSRRERWHVLPLRPRGTLSSRERRGLLAWEGLEPAAGWQDRRGLDVLRLLSTSLRTAPPTREGLPFGGGLALLLAYDLSHEIERLPCTTTDRDGLPWLHAVACPAALVVDAVTSQVSLVHVPDAGGEPLALAWGLTPAEAAAVERKALAALDAARGTAEPDGGPTGDVVALTSQDAYERMVREVKERLRAGDIYQANVSQRFEASWRGSALPLFGVLRRTNPSPFSGWLRGSGWEVVSASPERLVRLDGRELLTEPIAGTLPLPAGPSTTPEEVERAAAALRASAKDRAEHVMIVDLHRNDLGRVSAAGTVRAARDMRVDRRSHVVQAVAEVRGELRPGADALDVVEAVFPGGCVTGVPKVRSMEVIDRVEEWRRGPYTGSLGLLASWGRLDLNVLIRTAWRAGGTLAIQAGGGVVLDSVPELEHAESLAKARALLEAVEALGT